MLLAIDAGNTTINFALFEGKTIRGRWRASTALKRTADEWAVWLAQLMTMQQLSLSQISGVVIASVVPECLGELKRLCEQYFACTPLIVGSKETKINIGVEVDNPAEVGVDLLVGAIAALESFKPPLLVLDIGSAATLSFIDHKRAFGGVAIAPGLSLALKSLYSATAQLPQIVLEAVPHAIGTSTVTAMQGGTFWGYVGLIEGLIRRAHADATARGYTHSLPVIATGGDGQLIAQATKDIDVYEPDLLLKGLQLVYDYNKTKGDISFKARSIA